MPRKTLLKGVKRIVVKVGTSSLTDDDVISKHKIERLAADITGLLSRGYQVVLVTSGAISAGAGALHRQRNSLTIPERQALASVGQAILIDEYRHCFQGRGYAVGQILLTEDDVKHRRRFLNARHTMEALLEMKVIPIVNENDTVVVKEIKFGDNDTLSAHVASLVDADLLILLSDIDGFYWSLKDPEPVDEIRKITAEVTERAGGSGSIGGTGGMVTKLRAAEMMMRFGEKLIIANSSTPGILNRIMDGEKLGTLFIGDGKKLSSRKKWVALRKTRGVVVLDQGAVSAICDGKKSLLASGITAVRGTFSMGEIVALQDSSGKTVGKGIVNYSSSELDHIRGRNTREIRKLLGSTFYDEVVNRDDLIVF